MDTDLHYSTDRSLHEREEALDFSLDFSKHPQKLVAVVVQDQESKEILMVAWADQQAVETTVKTGLASFYSRSRGGPWTKGETSGHSLPVESILVDCDRDALIYLVKSGKSRACHTDNKNGQARKSCFYRAFEVQSNRGRDRSMVHLDP